ncbi:MAG: hypothetical protein AAFY76_00855 [Cyanobacteria bacterium J06649_11]
MDTLDNAKSSASSGHKLGQIIGDWYEEYFALPILQEVANELGMYCDSRFSQRDCRGEKILWQDYEGNQVDYDFVLELNGSNKDFGAPVAAFETFWRRGSRHSKDKARDDTGKLVPLKYTYPTLRVIGIISAGDFTKPAKELVYSRGVDLFYVDKKNIIDAWMNCGLVVDYPDRSSEEEKSKLTKLVTDKINSEPTTLKKVADELVRLVTPATIKGYKDRLIASIGSTPQRFVIQIQTKSLPIEFSSHEDANDFFEAEEPNMVDVADSQTYSYQVHFFNGDEFQRENLEWSEIRELHNDLRDLVLHLQSREG